MDIKQKRLRSHDFEANAAEALAVARDMSPGPEGIQALKVAGQLRSAAGRDVADPYSQGFFDAQ